MWGRTLRGKARERRGRADLAFITRPLAPVRQLVCRTLSLSHFSLYLSFIPTWKIINYMDQLLMLLITVILCSFSSLLQSIQNHPREKCCTKIIIFIFYTFSSSATTPAFVDSSNCSTISENFPSNFSSWYLFNHSFWVGSSQIIEK